MIDSPQQADFLSTLSENIILEKAANFSPKIFFLLNLFLKASRVQVFGNCGELLMINWAEQNFMSPFVNSQPNAQPKRS